MALGLPVKGLEDIDMCHGFNVELKIFTNLTFLLLDLVEDLMFY